MASVAVDLLAAQILQSFESSSLSKLSSLMALLCHHQLRHILICFCMALMFS
jgi:hypothetical protein